MSSQLQLQELERFRNKVRTRVLKKFTEILSEEELDFSKLSYDDLVAIISSADVSTLEEVSDSILDNDKLSFDEKMKLWSLIDERIRKDVGF